MNGINQKTSMLKYVLGTFCILGFIISWLIFSSVYDKHQHHFSLNNDYLLENQRGNSFFKPDLKLSQNNQFHNFNQKTNLLVEDCFNEKDDDGDGLIDCYDDDCAGIGVCDSFIYQYTDLPNCQFVPPTIEDFKIEKLYQTNKITHPIDQRSGVFTGDMDGDGVSELVSKDPNPGRIQIFNGADGSIEQSIVIPTNSAFSQPALADVDRNGKGDIFVIVNSNQLRRYEYGNPAVVWKTANQIGSFSTHCSPQVADFDQDGTPEVYVGNRVFNAIDGTRLAIGTGSTGKAFDHATKNNDKWPIAFDVFAPGDPKPEGGVFGPEAQGLELIAGNNVYTYTPGNGTQDNGSLDIVSSITGGDFKDGFTSIADIDGDNQIDIVLMSAGNIYIWNPRTQTQIGSTYDIPNTNTGGRINIGDFDNDGMVEIGTAGRNIYVVLEYDSGGDSLMIKWQKTGLDDGSQRTGSTLFDFEGDGINEVVYSEEGHLYIWKGSDGTELVKVEAEAGTRTEYPIVADINNDGAAEIIITAQNGNGPGSSGNDFICVYQSMSNPWVSARKVWNQHGYFVTNINDDLTVPVQQQDPIDDDLNNAYNGFLVQTTILNANGGSTTPAFAAPDAGHRLDSITAEACPDLVIHLTVKNTGSKELPASTPISFYNENPTGGSPILLGVSTVGSVLNTDDSTSITVTLDISPLCAPIEIFSVINDPGTSTVPYSFGDFPISGVGECDFNNNLDSLMSPICLEICGDGIDNDKDGVADEPNIIATDTSGCPNTTLPAFTTDEAEGTWSIMSDIGSTVTNTGLVSLGTYHSPTPNIDTVIYTGGLCSDTILISTFDDEAPKLSCPMDQVLMANISCQATVGDYKGLAEAKDNCSAMADIILTQTPASGTIVGLGTTVITITATDEAGNQTTCQINLVVTDAINPTITCPANTDEFVDGNCEFKLADYTSLATVNDNCSMAGNIMVTQSPAVGTTISGHNTNQVITLTARDESGNTVNCTFTITLKDTISPTIICPADITINADANCEGKIGDYTSQATVMENCTASGTISVTQSPTAGTLLSGHNDSETITLTADDGNGNTETCTFMVTLKDVTPPMLTCPSDQSLTVDANCEIIVPDYTGMVTKSDNCLTDAMVVLTQNPAAGTTIGVLDTMVKITITGDDTHGNIDSCAFFLTLKDEITPRITCPNNVSVTLDADCQATIADYTSMATIADNCTPDTDLTVTQSPSAGQLISSPGTTTITLTVEDESGNTAQCTFEVTYEDNTLPTITCPADVTIPVDGDCAIAISDYTGDGVISDNCSSLANLTVTQSPPAGTMLSGDGTMQTITLTVEDESGNTANCNFEVSLEDTTPPTITCPTDQNIYADANCEISIPDYTGATTASICASGNNIMVSQSPIVGTTISGHNKTQTITLTATDGSGNINQCTFDITVLDTIQPVLICPSDTTLYTDANCENTIPDLTTGLIYSDNCTAKGSITITQNPVAGTTISGDSAYYTITFTADDGNGNQNQCEITLSLIDTTPPIISCLTNQMLFADADCQGVIPNYTSQITIADNCAGGNEITITQSPIAGTLLLGHNDIETITITVIDNSGNNSICTLDVLLKDTIAPTISCPADITLNADADCEVAIGDYTSLAVIDDNCTATGSITVSQSPAAGTLLTGHNDMETITLTADDENGNTSTCTFKITLVDITPPVLTCPSNQVIAVNGNCEITIPDYTGMVTKSDNCLADASVVLTQSPTAGTTISVLDTMVEITIIGDDTYGNIDSCSFFLTLKDEIVPTITCPSDISIDLDGNCQAVIADYTTAATITDNCTPNSDLTVTQSPSAGQIINTPGTTTITLRVEDESGNMANCTFDVTYEDNTNPTITCPTNDTLGVDGVCAIPLPDYTGNASYADNCSINANMTITQNPVAGTMIMGDGFNQLVTLTVEDEFGNTAQCTFTVSLRDITDPSISCPGDENLYADNNCQVLIPDYTGDAVVSTNCASGGSVTVTQSPVVNTVISGHGTSQIITLTATDGSGNTNQCTFEVTVVDTIQPSLTCPIDSTFYAISNCKNIIPDLTGGLTYTDNCTPTNAIAVSQQPVAGTTISGDSTSYTITFTVDDGNGNQSQCSMTVELIDTTAPIINCITDQMIFTDASCQQTIPNYIPDLNISDNCATGSDLTITQNPIGGTILTGHNANTTVTITATDNSGNMSTCTFELTLKDTIPPIIACPTDITINADADCEVAIEDYRSQATVGDNCTSSSTIIVTQSPAAGTLLAGHNDIETITLTANDGNGNTTTCTFTITLKDVSPPILTCPSNQSITVDANCEITIPDYTDSVTKSDNCLVGAAIVLTQTPPAGTTIGVLDTMVKITITGDDTHGNVDSCAFFLTLKDEIAPTISCPNDIAISLDANCQATIADYTSMATIGDNCTPDNDLMVTQSPSAGQIITTPGTATITLTVEDESGNTTQCSFDVMYEDTTNPTITCPGNDTISIDGDCAISLADYTNNITIGDNCSTDANLIVTQNPAAGTQLSGNGAKQVVTITVEDESGNTTQCMLTVLLEDVTPPMITCPANQILYADADCSLPIPDYTNSATITSDCETGNGITISQSPIAGTTISGHNASQVITLTATDNSGNSTQCTFSVTVLDTIAPMLVCPMDSTIYTDANCKNVIPDLLPVLGYSDNCTATGSLVPIQSPTAGTVISGDSTSYTITFTIDDGNGNQSQCSMTVELIDTTAPTLVCIGNQTLYANTSCTGIVPNYIPEIGITDDCASGNEFTITQSPNAGMTLTGHNDRETVTITVTDNSGNTSTCIFEVILKDTILPQITCPANQQIVADADCKIVVPNYISSANFSDNCTPSSSLNVTQKPVAGTVLSNLGADTTITLIADDGNGNLDSCSFLVSLIDETAPIFTCPTNQTVYLNNTCGETLSDYRDSITVTDNCSATSNLVITQLPAPGTSISQHDTEISITLEATDESNNTTTCSFTIILKDTIPPSIICPTDKVMALDGDCEFSIPDLRSEIITTDNCVATNNLTINQSPAQGTIFSNHNTTQAITFTVDDGNGNIATCSILLTIKDSINPVILCPSNQSINVGTDCEILVPDYTNSAIISDNCTSEAAITVTQSPIMGTTLSGSETEEIITLYADDGNGNIDSCKFILSLTDTIPPTIACPEVQTIIMDGNCEFLMPDYTGRSVYDDNCLSSGVTLTQKPAPGTLLSGTDSVFFTIVIAEDYDGNLDSCDFLVVLKDTIKPTVVCMANQNIYLDEDCLYEVEDYTGSLTVSDNCSITQGIEILQFPPEGVQFSGANTTHTITLAVVDESGNETQCSFDVTLLDTIAPLLICPDTQYIDVDGICSITIPDYTDAATLGDNCSLNENITIIQSPTDISLTGDGTTQEVTLTATDESGNSTTCKFLLKLVDRTNPSITCPGNQDIQADADCKATIPDYRNQAIITNDCEDITNITVNQVPEPGTIMLSGLNSQQEVTIYAKDQSGNKDSCKFTITLQDTIPPMVTCLDIDTLFLDACYSEIPDYSDLIITDDNCSPTSTITITQSIAAGQLIIEDHEGVRIITIYAKDEANNIASCEFPIVFIDSFPPYIECPNDTLIYLDDNCELVVPDYTDYTINFDNCADLGDVIVTQDPVPGTILQGTDTTYTITLIADDSHGNQSTCNFDILLEDTIKPVIICPVPQQVYLDGNCEFALADYASMATISDNCEDNTTLRITQSPVVGTIISTPNVPQQIILTVDDGNGNNATCTFEVIHLDTIKPELICSVDQILKVDDDCQIPLPDYTDIIVSDNCSSEKNISIKQSPAPGTLVSGHGNTTIITLTATDESGNSQSCSFTLTHVDKTAPKITCPDTQKLVLNDQCQAILPDYTTLGNVISTCQVNNFVAITNFTIEQQPEPGTILSGINTKQEILLIVKDPQGNADSCTFNVALYVDLPDLYVRKNVHPETPIQICMDHPCVTPGSIKAFAKDGSSTGRGLGADGNFIVDSLTGCVTYEVGAFPKTDIDSFCIIVCDKNNCCDTVNYQIEIDNYQAFIVDPCVCLDNATSLNSEDGQFYEYIKITSPSGEIWPIISVTGFYENPAGGINIPISGGNPYPLIPITAGSTPFIEIPRGDGISDYYLGGLHIGGIGYSLTVGNQNDTLNVSNICDYPCGISGGGLDGIPPPDAPPIGIKHNRSKTTIAENTLNSCDGILYYNFTVHNLYIDTAACRTTQIICPQNQWQRLKVTFSEFDLAAGDTLCVFEGKDTIGTPIAKWSGTGVSQTGGWISAQCAPDVNPSGCLTFLFKTNGDNNKGLGWRSTATCEENDITLNAEDLHVDLTCEATHKMLTIKPATVVSGCTGLQDSQFVRIYNVHKNLYKDTCLASNQSFDLAFAIGQYKVVYQLKSDTVKSDTATISVKETAIICNDEITIPMGSGCSIDISPDDLLENPCDTITDTVYYFITLKGIDKNGQELVLASGGGKGGNYPVLTKDMIDKCSATIIANIERRYYEGLNLAFYNNGPKQISCNVKVNIKDELAPVFNSLFPDDTLVVCNVDLTPTGLSLPTPEAVDNCGPATVTFGGAEIVTPSINICDTTKAIITWKATDECGNSTTTTQQVVIVRPQLSDIVKTGQITLTCDSETEIEENTTIPGIKIGRLKNGVLVATDTLTLSTTEYICGYILQYTDIQIPATDCGRKVFRNWEILDWCNSESGPLPIDTTFIEFRDTKAPQFVEGAGVNKVINLDHQSCTYDAYMLAGPTATDNCSTPSVRLASIERIENGTTWILPASEWAALDCDSFQLSWIAEDDCHEQLVNDTITQIIVIQDVTKPSVNCTDNINLSLGQDKATLHYSAIDAGSYDACGISKYEVSRDELVWDSIVVFDCEDIHNSHKVYLRVTDNKGNQNTCWMSVNVEDKLMPICSDLPDVNTTCEQGHIGDGLATTDTNNNGKVDETEWIDLTTEQAIEFNNKYGQPNCSDNVTCGALVVEQQYQYIKKSCGVATLKRRYRAIDWQGEGNISNWAEQTINVETKAGWVITLPADWKGKCGDDVPDPGVTIANGACDVMGYETNEKVFTTVEDACLKIIRTFTITNWCKYESGGETVVISRKEDEHGFVKTRNNITSEGYENVGRLTYVQISKLQDETTPEINVSQIDNCIKSDNCKEIKHFAITAQDCNEAATAALVYNWAINSNDTQLAKGEGAFFEYEVTFKVDYEVRWTVTDNCGNAAWETRNYEFVDCKKPAPYCINGVTVELMETGVIQVWANDFDRGSSDNCTSNEALTHRIWHESLGEAPTDLADVQTLPEVITFDCASIGQQSINLYVIDEVGNWDFCTTSVIVQDNGNTCSNINLQSMATLSGTIINWKKKTMEQVDVQVSNSSSMITGIDGQYNFELAKEQNYTILPQKNDNPLNGVSTFDLVLISKHILGIDKFDNPYQYIAADANKSNTITAFDMVQIRQLILNIKTEFTNNESWRFVVANQEFENINALKTNFMEIGQVNNLSHDSLIDFVAVKIGDVNGNAKTNSLLIAEDRSPENSFEITTTDRYLKAGEKVSVPFTTTQINNILGYQFTLAFDNLRLEKLHSGLSKVENFGLHQMDKGRITTSWNQQKTRNSRQITTLFTIDFIAKQDGKLSEQLSIIGQPTIVEAYASGNTVGEKVGELLNVHLSFTKEVLEGRPFELFQNEPNPFKVNTSIGFYLPGDTEIQLVLRDEMGRVLKTLKENRNRGYNTILVEKEALTNGFIYYQLSTKFGTQAKKMLYLD